jgi:uncharacterized protein VirK/YbjX
MTLSALFAMHRAGPLVWSRPSAWLRLIRSARLLLHPADLSALLDLEIVKDSLIRSRGRGALSFLIDRHSLARPLSLQQRIDCALYHYRFEQTAFSDRYIDAVYRDDGLVLWRQQDAEHVFDVRLMIGNDNLKEGFLSSVAFIDGQRVCVMSFSFVDAALFGQAARPTLFVTRKQSGRHPEHLRHFARSFKHTSPAYFCFAAIAGIARALDAQEIAVIRHHAQTGYSPEHADVMRKSYDDFWHSVGACELDEKALQVAVPLEQSEHGELSAAHRARARKRREQRKAVEESACTTLRELSRSPSGDCPAGAGADPRPS